MSDEIMADQTRPTVEDEHDQAVARTLTVELYKLGVLTSIDARTEDLVPVALRRAQTTS